MLESHSKIIPAFNLKKSHLLGCRGVGIEPTRKLEFALSLLRDGNRRALDDPPAHPGGPERNKATRIAKGTITLAEVRAYLLRDLKDSEPPYRELIDARGAVVKLSSAEVQEIVELLRSLSRSYRLGRIAVVVSTDVAYGMMRMLQILVEDVCVVQPFRDVAEAERWLSH